MALSKEQGLRKLLQSTLKKLCRLLLDEVQPLSPHPGTPRSSQEDNYLQRGSVEWGSVNTQLGVITGPPFTGPVTLSKFLHLSKPWFPHL